MFARRPWVRVIVLSELNSSPVAFQGLQPWGGSQTSVPWDPSDPPPGSHSAADFWLLALEVGVKRVCLTNSALGVPLNHR